MPNFAAGALMPRPVPAAFSELRIALPSGATAIALDWEFFSPEIQNSNFNDGMNIAIVDAAGNYVQSLVSADTFTPLTPAGCSNGGGSVLAAGPQAFSANLNWPRPAGAYLSIVCFNEGDTIADSSVSIDNVRFSLRNDDCANAIPIGEGSFFWTNNGATPVLSNVTCNTTLSRDVWFSYTNTGVCPETVNINTCMTAGEPAPVLNDTVLRVYDACGGPCLTANDDFFCPAPSTTGLRSNVTITVPAGATRLIAVGSFGNNVGNAWTLTLSATNALKVLVGTGCGSPAPILDSNSPVLGQMYNLSITGATPASSGLLFYGPQAGPTNIGGTCNLYLGNSGLNVLLPLTTDAAGAWNFALPLPADPSLCFLPVGLQAFIASTNGINLTNGLHITLGN